MDLNYTLAHFLIPRHTNNYKARLLSNVSLLSLALVLVLVRNILGILSMPHLAVLGYAANISPAKVIELTNNKRLEAGVGVVRYSPKLEEAAKLKAQDMLTKDYWAHTAPDGTEPWDFFKSVGYVYRYAGENLARDFSSPESAIEAWLASPSHRENMLSAKYTEIGVAVVEGDLDGKDTTLIVQLFGTPRTTAAAVSEVSAKVEEEVAASPVPVSENRQLPSVSPAISANNFDIMRVVAIAVILVLVAALLIDIVVVTRRGIVRTGGKAVAHFSFIVMVLVILLVVKAGEIL